MHEFLFLLLKTLLRGPVTQWDRDVYNTAVNFLYKNFAHFVAMHYTLSNRFDTEYWKANSSRTYSPDMIDLQPSISIGFNSLQNNKMFAETLDPAAGITYVSVGLNYPSLDMIGQKWHEHHEDADHKKLFQSVFDLLDQNKAQWAAAAVDAPSLYEYLKKHIYE